MVLLTLVVKGLQINILGKYAPTGLFYQAEVDILHTGVSITEEVPVVESRSELWRRRIADLLRRHGLTTRTAEEWCKFEVSSTWIGAMIRGKIPLYETAAKFLNYFPRDEAVECLKAAGFPIPEEWTEVICERPFLTIVSEPDSQPLTQEAKKEVMEAVTEILAKHRKRTA